MAHKQKNNQDKRSLPYTVKDAMKIADDVFELSREKEYNLGAFVHGLIFALEYAQYSYKIPQQQIASIKRDSRRYFKEIDNIKQTTNPSK